jgi:enoyl-CoA hydratase/carnithine racemase
MHPLSAQELTDVGLRLEVDGPIATVVLANPAVRNAQTPATWAALARVGAALPDAVRIVVVTAEGPSFCAGLDVRLLTAGGLPGAESLLDLAARDDDAIATTIARFQEGFVWWRDPRRVSIAAVHGEAVGAGFQLALACDLRVVADDARFCMRETALGLVPDLAGTKPLVELVGYARALEICATSRWVGASEAAGIGLVNAVVPRAELADTVRDLCAALLSVPAGAVAETKALLLAAAHADYDGQRAREGAAQVRRLRALALAGEESDSPFR